MAHRARYAAAMAAITRRLPFGLSEVIQPNMVGYLLINLCTFFVDLGLLGVFHGHFRWPLPVAVSCSYASASVLSYVLNRVLNFRSHAELGRQFPVYVAVSVSNYLIFVLGLFDLLSAVGVYYELSRVLAACCEGVYLYCMMRWVVFRDVSEVPIGHQPSPEPATASAAPVPSPTAMATAEATVPPEAGPPQEPASPKPLPR